MSSTTAAAPAITTTTTSTTTTTTSGEEGEGGSIIPSSRERPPAALRFAGSSTNFFTSSSSSSSSAASFQVADQDPSQQQQQQPQQQSPFYLIIHGVIDGAQHQEAPGNLYCHYCVVRGKDWQVVRAQSHPGLLLEEGVTQLACCSGGLAPSFVWNHPFEATLASTNPFGWPRLVVAVYTVAGGGTKDVVKGYGWAHLPVVSGTHTLQVPLFVPTTPLTASPLERVMMAVSGFTPELRDPTWVCQGVGHELIRVRGVRGTVKVTLNVVLHHP